MLCQKQTGRLDEVGVRETNRHERERVKDRNADSERTSEGRREQGCQMAKFDSFLSLDCARVEGGGRNPRKGRNQILQRSVAEP